MWKLHFLPLLVLPFFLIPPPSASTEFLFNSFDPANLLLYGNTTIGNSTTASAARNFISVTAPAAFSVGRVLLSRTIPARSNSTKKALPFSTSFVFSIAPIPGVLPGHGIALLFSPTPGTGGATAAQHLGLFNRTTDNDASNGIFAIEFDVFKNPEFNDIDNNHVGVDIHSLTSTTSHTAGYWPDSGGDFVNLVINDGSNYQAWVDYDSGKLNVTIAPVVLGRKPSRPLFSVDLDLSSVFSDEMYVGFCAATGKLIENHRILAWSFSNTNFSLSNALITTGFPNFIPIDPSATKKRALAAGLSLAVVAILIFAAVVGFYVYRKRQWRRKLDEMEGGEYGGGDAPMEEWEVDYWPHRIGYRQILAATDCFSEKNLIGSGGSGKVYKGVIGGSAVAVKLFGRSTGEEARGFLAEVTSLGRLKHRNLVGLKGWCRKRGGDLILVYEYMDNSSLDKRIFPEFQFHYPPLDWKSRVRILKDVAAGVLYLHEGWESRVLHRDIKASNVMLDGDMVGRLGDFGLAKIQPHGGIAATTKVVGTVGYMAPESVRSGKSTAATDAFGFGVLILEVVFGRQPAADGSPPLVEWAWDLVERGEVSASVPAEVKSAWGFDDVEADKVVRLGLMCCCPEPAGRPSMRQVVRVLDGKAMDGGEGSRSSKGDNGSGEGPEEYLLEKLNRAAAVASVAGEPWVGSKMRSRYDRALGHDHHHLTFDELRQSILGSTSLSASDIIIEGR